MKISPIKLRYAYLEHSDWLGNLEWPIRELKNEWFDVASHVTSFNQLERFSYLFQRSIVMLHLNLFMALTPVVNVIKLFLKEI